MEGQFKDKKVLTFSRSEKARTFKPAKKVLIFGLGLNQGGVGAARFFAKQGTILKVTDLKTEKELKISLDQLSEFKNIEYTLGVHKYEDIDWADLIIKNPAVKPSNPYIEYAISHGKQVETDMGIFLKFVKPSQVIGITGTKGKTTTASLIYEVLKHSRDDTLFAGNIGKSVLDTLEFVDKNTLVILELSSFQLEGWDNHKASPHISVITNILPDHLNYYKTMEEYIEAKKIIAKYQTKDDYLIISKDDKVLNSPDFIKNIKSNIIKFSSDDLSKDFQPTLDGEHNRANYAAALKVSQLFNFPQDEVLKAMNNFKGAEFRQQFIKEFNGIKVINDSAATNPDATIAALNTFSNIILICGGIDKGLPYEKLAYSIDRRVKAVYFLEGSATEKIKENIKNQEILRATYSDLRKLLADVKLEAKKGDVILFSPGAASFNLFQNEFDRGRRFNQAVNKTFQ